MTIIIFINSPHGNVLQDLDWPETHPVGGSETAGVRMAQALRHLGETVQIVTDAAQLQPRSCDIFIALRYWQVFRNGFLPGQRNFLWCQDDVDLPHLQPLLDPQVAQSIYNGLDGVILLSQYQAQRWQATLHAPVGKVILTTNGIPLSRFNPQPEKLAARKPWAYYSSTPFRGLELLVLAWPHIVQRVPEAQLHICSSMKIYQPDQTVDTFSPLYEQARVLPGVHYYNSVGQAELRRIAQQCRVLAYPCIFPETSCIAAMEAMAAGCVVVGTALGALPETAWQNPLVFIGDGWLQRWIDEVLRVFTENSHYEQKALQNLNVVRYYDWDLVARNWQRFLRMN